MLVINNRRSATCDAGSSGDTPTRKAHTLTAVAIAAVATVAFATAPAGAALGQVNGAHCTNASALNPQPLPPGHAIGIRTPPDPC